MKFLGIDDEKNFLRLAYVDKRGKNVSICKLLTLDVKQLYKEKDLCFKKNNITSAIKAKDLLIKSLSLQIKKKSSLIKALPFQMQSLTSLPEEESLIAPIINDYSDNNADIRVFVTTKQQLHDHLEKMQEMHIDPDFVSCEAIALASFSKYIAKDLSSHVIVHLGMNKTLCVLVEKGLPKASYSINFGIKTLLNALDPSQENLDTLLKKAKDIDLQKLCKEKQSLLFSATSTLTNEIKKAVLSFAKNYPHNKIPILFTGIYSSFKNLDSLLEKTLKDTTSDSIQTPLDKYKPYAICIGLALSSANRRKDFVQFRQKNYTKLSHMKKRACFLAFLFIFSSCISIFLYFNTNKALNNYENYLSNNISQIELLEKKYFSEKPLYTTEKKISLSEKISALKERFEKEKIQKTYFHLAPTISEVLSWISTFSTEDDNGIEIVDIHYELEKYPNIKALKEPTLAKVILEFKTITPLTAEAFHDYIQHSKEFIQTNQDIKWETLEDSYKTIFYLKNKNTKDCYGK